MSASMILVYVWIFVGSTFVSFAVTTLILRVLFRDGWWEL